MKKTRILIQVDRNQLQALKGMQRLTGASVAEIVRRAISAYLKKRDKRR
jgi:hypothetical protein